MMGGLQPWAARHAGYSRPRLGYSCTMYQGLWASSGSTASGAGFSAQSNLGYTPGGLLTLWHMVRGYMATCMAGDHAARGGRLGLWRLARDGNAPARRQGRRPPPDRRGAHCSFSFSFLEECQNKKIPHRCPRRCPVGSSPCQGTAAGPRAMPVMAAWPGVTTSSCWEPL